ncbi:MFS transporter [Microbacterium sp. 4R-513]|uniref:MFS transporter n=1 Tax=Microbacterium sp. 4R-513 TaxID=2567934 RepID=UPI0013E14589|nr:MFS transporter [Microbacterium sp. 4R-513]QIG40941.1 MFS transporter [Microbacterium sp. 4R-513]
MTNRTARVPRTPALRPWSMVVGLGFVSLLIDMVADGSAAVSGAMLEELGATALLVGLVTGGAEALALLLRLATGPWADRTGAYWTFTILGYALTAVSVPLLFFTPMLGAAGLAVASALLLIERTGKAIRAPAKTVLLADAAGAVGRGKGFGVHKTLDQIGAFAGPLVVAGVAAIAGSLWPAFLVLIIPGAAAMVLLFWLRAKVPDPSLYRTERGEAEASVAAEAPAAMGPESPAASESPAVSTAVDTRADDGPSREASRTFLMFSFFAGLTEFGLLSFGVISFHLAAAELVTVSAVPLVYAVGMAAAAVAAILTGWLYDRWGAAVLLSVPVITVFVPGLVLGPTVVMVLAGVVLWGAASGVQDSTVKALVADLVPGGKRGSAYGSFAVFQGVGALAGAVVAGALYDSIPVLIAIVAVLQVAALILLVVVLRRRARLSRPGP